MVKLSVITSGRLAFGALLFVLAFAPLAFGTVEYWSKAVAQLVVSAGLIFCLLGLWRSGQPLLRVPGLLPLLLLLGLVLLQLVPLPVGLLKVISPQSWEAYRPVYEQAGGDGWLPLSVHRKATLQEFLRLGAGVLLFVLTLQVLRSGGRIKRALGFVVALGSVIAFFAILQQFSADGRIYWFRPAPGGSPGGPWININQYAAFIEALCPLALALFLFYRPRVSPDMSWRERFVSFFSSAHSNLHLFLGFAFVLLAFSVFVSLCRGGIITILLSMLLFALLKGIVQRGFGRVSIWVVFCLVLLAVSWFGWQPIAEEFDKAIGDDWTIQDGRTTLYADTLRIIRNFPLVGAGFGTFVDVYPSYQTINTDRVFEHAHNDYLEMLTNGGVLGFALMAWFVVAVVLHGWRRAIRRRDRYAVLLGIGALTSIAALLMHSVVDFNLQNGAIGLYFFFLCGLLVAVVNTRHGYGVENQSFLAPAGRRQLPGLLLFSVVFFCVVLVVQYGVLRAGHSFNRVKPVYISSHLDPVIMERVVAGVTDAGRWDPLESFYPFYRGNLAVVRESRAAALMHYQWAALLRPMEGIYLQRIGLMLPIEQSDKATVLITEGYRRALLKHWLVASTVEWQLISGQRMQAIELLTEWFVRDPRQAATLIPLMETYRFSRDEVAEVLPPSVEAWILFGQYKEDVGEIEDAGYYRNRALDFVGQAEEVRPGWFFQLISYYQRHNQPGEALSVLRRAVELIPDHAPFHIMLGDHYRRENITYRALEEYQKAVALEPGNESYRRRLRKLELDIEFGK
jgi:O-antigen ligase/tetratricopeptide (TPR) repeat protein